jgi:hypothetical protein
MRCFLQCTVWQCDMICLQSLRREKVLRVFKLNTGQDDHAIMFLDDYLTQVGCLYLLTCVWFRSITQRVCWCFSWQAFVGFSNQLFRLEMNVLEILDFKVLCVRCCWFVVYCVWFQVQTLRFCHSTDIFSLFFILCAGRSCCEKNGRKEAT